MDDTEGVKVLQSTGNLEREERWEGGRREREERGRRGSRHEASTCQVAVPDTGAGGLSVPPVHRDTGLGGLVESQEEPAQIQYSRDGGVPPEQGG